MIRLLILSLLTSCVADQSAPRNCGPAPLAPGFVASFDGDTVTMSRSSYLAIIAWRDDVASYTACVEDAP